MLRRLNKVYPPNAEADRYCIQRLKMKSRKATITDAFTPGIVCAQNELQSGTYYRIKNHSRLKLKVLVASSQATVKFPNFREELTGTSWLPVKQIPIVKIVAKYFCETKEASEKIIKLPRK